MMTQFFRNAVKAETESLKALNEAYYESDEKLKALKNRQAKVTTEVAIKNIYGDYIVYQLYYKKKQPQIIAISLKALLLRLEAILTIANLF